MGFYVQDDFWEALEEQPAKVQDEVIGALARLFFTGEATELKGVSKSLFVAFRDRVLLARKRSDAGKSKRQSDGDQTEEQNPNQNSDQKAIKQESKPGTNGDQTEEQNRSDLLKSERESEKKKEKTLVGRRFAPPTPAKVREYAESRGEHIDAERFCDFYASKGWKVGSSPMKDWQAAARNWVARSKPKGGAPNVDLGKFAAGSDDVF